MGDFNYKGIEWDKLNSDKAGMEFFNLTQECLLYQHVNSPTRGGEFIGFSS